MKKKQSKNILRVTCPHCYWVNNEYPDDHNLWCGDGDTGDLTYEDGESYLVTSCDKCGEDIKIDAWIPEMVEAELSDKIDYYGWLSARDINAVVIANAHSNYAQFPIGEAITLIIKNYKSTKRPPELGKLKVDKRYKSSWKELINDCWEKRDRIKGEE
jgi:hypothetical protein